MSLFQSILTKLQSQLKLQENDLTSVAACITQLTSVPLSPSQLSIKKGTLVINVPPTFKLAILSKKDAILSHCKEQMIGVYSIR